MFRLEDRKRTLKRKKSGTAKASESSLFENDIVKKPTKQVKSAFFTSKKEGTNPVKNTHSMQSILRGPIRSKLRLERQRKSKNKNEFKNEFGINLTGADNESEIVDFSAKNIL